MTRNGKMNRRAAGLDEDRLLRLQPNNLVASDNLAFMMVDNGTDLDQAMTMAQRAKQQSPNNADISDTLGWIYIKKNLSDSALAIFRISSRTSRSVHVPYHFAMALFQKGDRYPRRRSARQPYDPSRRKTRK